MSVSIPRRATPVIAAVALSFVLSLALAGCRTGAASSDSVVPSPAAVTVTTPSATPSSTASADPLANIDSLLATVNGATQQAASDLSDGDAAAATDDSEQ